MINSNLLKDYRDYIIILNAIAAEFFIIINKI